VKGKEFVKVTESRPSVIVDLLTASLGDGLYLFFAAKALIAKVGHGTISNANFAEWGLKFPKLNPAEYDRVIVIDKIEEFNIELISNSIRQGETLFVKVRHHLERQSLYLSKDYYNRFFPIISDCYVAGENEILINIRAGDITSGGTHWYPLVPINFYKDVIEKSRLTPIFMGQLDSSEYVRELRAAFPNAEFKASRGPIDDFDMIRRASYIIPSVSTFSLAAAWLSDARTIHLPLNGFLNPAHMREIDLVPVDDLRYRFYLFPLNFALPEEAALIHHKKIDGSWAEISRSKLHVLQRNSPLITRSASALDSQPVQDFDEKFYIHAHIDAALAVSNGWYEDGLHHYKDIGRLLDYSAVPLPNKTMKYPNFALNKRAWQSSNSIWSKGRGVQEDAMAAVNGNRMSDDYFHTELEDEPWWLVDCGADIFIKEVHVYNCKGDRILQERASPLRVQCSRDQRDWDTILETEPGFIFGAGAESLTPLVCKPTRELVGRYIKISIPKRKTYLHLAQVEVYGLPV